MPDLDEKNDETVVADTVTPTSITVTDKTNEGTPIVKKLELTPEELDAIKADAVAQARQENEERIRREEAERQGNYKLLFEQAEEDRKQANLQLWRQRALNKFKLPDDLEDSLLGETEEDLMKVAKKLRNSIDKEVEAKLKADTVIPPDPHNATPPRQRVANADEVTKRNLSRALNIGRVLH